MDNIQAASQNMLNMAGKIGEHMRENEWLMSIKQRVGIPGGACEFDLPSYHYWLHLDPECAERSQRVACAAAAAEEGFSIVLHLLRNSGKTFRHTAHRGVFQQMGSGRVAHMLCLKVDESLALRSGNQRQQVCA